MYRFIFMIAAMALTIGACRQGRADKETATDEHNDVKFQYISYNDHFELFAEADPFIAGKQSNVLSHFSTLPGFRAVESGRITLILEVAGNVARQTLEKPTRKGIYSFDITPSSPGKGSLRFEISSEDGAFQVIVPEVMIFSNPEEARLASEKINIPRTNATVFTKEQSWKIDFATGYPGIQPFGPVIRTSGLVEPAPGAEMVVTAKTGGIVSMTGNALFAGTEVSRGQVLCTVTGNAFAEDNFSVKYNEARINYEKSKSDYERSMLLAQDKIISEKDLLEVKNEYESSKAIFDNLSKNFSDIGETVKSPMNGFIREVYIQNGTYVTAGQPILAVAQSQALVIQAEVPQRYASSLGYIESVNIREQTDSRTWSLEDLDGRVVSFGKSAGPDSYLVPLTIQITNNGSFMPGELVELYLKTITNVTSLTIPNSALLEEQGNFYVWVQITPELFEKREVTIGKTDGIRTEVTNRLSVTDRIVTQGALMVKLAQATGSLDAHSGHVH